MKILIIAPPFLSIPIEGQGGTERIIFGQIQELAKLGHDVTLFGAGNARVPCQYEAIFPKAISEQKFSPDTIEQSRPLRIETAYLAKVMQRLIEVDGQFDVVFNHARGGYIFLPVAQKLKTPIISTMHLPIFTEVADVFRLFKNPNIVSISNAQRKPAPDLNYLATVYNGLDLSEFPYNEKGGDYLFYMGAIGEHKNPFVAIEVAKATGEKLIMASGKLREPYFSDKIKPQIDDKQIKFFGEARGADRGRLLGGAKAFIFPITWEEPFGLVMIEAMACGTPVIAFNHGAVPEVVVDGETGFVCETKEYMIEAVKKIDQIDRTACRRRVESNFTYEIMTRNYLKAAEKVFSR